jgi:hypothetical protein
MSVRKRLPLWRCSRRRRRAQFWLGFADWWVSCFTRTMPTKCAGVWLVASAKGLNAGGKAYGYAPAVGEWGKRIIAKAEAKIVQRIFELKDTS